MSGAALLLAQGGGDIIGILLVILFVVVPAILQIIGKAREEAPKGKGRPARPRPVPRAQGGGGQGGGQGGGVEDEIEAFLRRAAEQNQGKAGGGPPRAEVVDEVVVLDEPPLGGAIEKQVSYDLDSRKFDEFAGRLGQRAATADTQFAQRTQQVFQHDLGKLSRSPGESAASPIPVGEPEQPDDSVFDLPETAAAGLPVLRSEEHTSELQSL